MTATNSQPLTLDLTLVASREMQEQDLEQVTAGLSKSTSLIPAGGFPALSFPFMSIPSFGS